MSGPEPARHPDGRLVLPASALGIDADMAPDGAPRRHLLPDDVLKADVLTDVVRKGDVLIGVASPEDEPSEDGRLDAGLAAQIAAGLASSTDLERTGPLRPHSATVEPVRLIGTPSYDVWITGWSPGQRGRLVDLTAPGGTIALAVADGALLELDGDGRLDRGRRLAKGAVLAAEDGATGAVAELVNGGTADATTVHVCSPPRQLTIGHQRT